MVTDLNAETERVRACAGRRDPQALDIVVGALESKWDGLQSVALQVLGVWGDDDSRRRLRTFLEDAADRPRGWSVRGVAVRALAGCVMPSDAPWVLDRYFQLPGVLAKHEFLPVVLALPPAATRSRFVHESEAAGRDNRQAAMKAIGNTAFADRADLLRRFLDDDDAEIRRGANILIGRPAAP